MDERVVEHLVQQLLKLDRRAVRDTFYAAEGDPLQRIESLLVPALERIGAGWEAGDIALSQVYMSGRICEDVLNSLLPPGAPERRQQPKIALVVLEDYHLLGKRIVYSMLQAGGFAILDYARAEVDEVVQRCQADQVEVLLISTLMLPSALRVAAVREQLPDSVSIVVGGAPFRLDAQLWQEVGADAMGYNASDALAIIKQLAGGTV